MVNDFFFNKADKVYDERNFTLSDYGPSPYLIFNGNEGIYTN